MIEISTLKEKLKRDYINNNIYNNSNSIVEGIVTKTNEKANVCTVKYTNKFGSVTSVSTEVLLSNTGMCDWFPKKNEKVLLMENDDVVLIIGPKFKSLKNDKDILSDFSIGGIGGELF